MKYFFIALFTVVAISLAGFGLKVLMFPANTATNLLNTAYDASNKTLNADNAIYNYEWFKKQYEDIQATSKKIDNIKVQLDSFVSFAGDRSTWTFEDKQQYSTLQSTLLGTQNYYESAVAEYNARAKMANRNIFINSILPSFIESLTFIKK